MSIDRITITRPDDWHLHLRDGAHMQAVLRDTARAFARAIIMPNLKPPVTTTALALSYRERICAAVPRDMQFAPLMTLYLTDNTQPEEIAKARASGAVYAVKYYPAGATTNSDSGVTDIKRCYAVLETMEKHGMPLLVHGEVTDPDVDIFDRERVFIERVLTPLITHFPQLKVVMEHITTEDGVQYVMAARSRLAATITAHHLLISRNALFEGGIRPHLYCLPIAKREHHRQALLGAAASGDPRFFLGTDSAPHARQTKETACGCAGVYTAHAAVELYAEAFDAVGKLDRLEPFACHFGADFYGLPRNTERVTLVRESRTVPAELRFGSDTLVPFRAGTNVCWRLM